MSEIKFVRRCVKAIILNEEGQILILRNREPGHDTDQQFWDFPGGGQEKGEYDFGTIQREIYEEIGCEVTTLRGREPYTPYPQPVVEWRTPHYADKGVEMNFVVYGVIVKDLDIKLSEEHDRYAWVDPRNLNPMEFPSSVREQLPAIALYARQDSLNNNITEIFEMGMVERAHALAKWGDKPRTPAEWALILEEEVNECKAAYAKSEDNEKVMKEMMQVFATSLGCLLEHGWRLRDNLHPNTVAKLKELGWDNIIGDLIRMNK